MGKELRRNGLGLCLNWDGGLDGIGEGPSMKVILGFCIAIPQVPYPFPTMPPQVSSRHALNS